MKLPGLALIEIYDYVSWYHDHGVMSSCRHIGMLSCCHVPMLQGSHVAILSCAMSTFFQAAMLSQLSQPSWSQPDWPCTHAYFLKVRVHECKVTNCLLWRKKSPNLYNSKYFITSRSTRKSWLFCPFCANYRVCLRSLHSKIIQERDRALHPLLQR